MDEKNEKYEKIEMEQDQSVDISDQSDETVLENPQVGFSKGIETDEFDILPAMEESAG